MGMLCIHQGKSKPGNKKPGWKQQEAEYAAWLAGVKSQKLGAGRGIAVGAQAAKPIDVRKPTITPDRLLKLPSRATPGGAGTKPVPRPDICTKRMRSCSRASWKLALGNSMLGQCITNQVINSSLTR
jgi:hypothetical protein